MSESIRLKFLQMAKGEPKTARPPSEWLVGLTGAGYDSKITPSVKFNEITL